MDYPTNDLETLLAFARHQRGWDAGTLAAAIQVAHYGAAVAMARGPAKPPAGTPEDPAPLHQVVAENLTQALAESADPPAISTVKWTILVEWALVLVTERTVRGI